MRSVFAESGSCFAPLHGGNIHIARPLENRLEVLPRRSDRTARPAPKCLKAQRKVRDKARTAGRSSDPVLKYWRQRGARLGWATRGRFRRGCWRSTSGRQTRQRTLECAGTARFCNQPACVDADRYGALMLFMIYQCPCSSVIVVTNISLNEPPT